MLIRAIMIAMIGAVFWKFANQMWVGPQKLIQRIWRSQLTITYSCGYRILVDLISSINIRLKLKTFYSLNQSVFKHLLSKILAFLAFIALYNVQFGEKSNKKISPAKFFQPLRPNRSWFWISSGLFYDGDPFLTINCSLY